MRTAAVPLAHFLPRARRGVIGRTHRNKQPTGGTMKTPTMKLGPGQWAFWLIDRPMPKGLSVFEGPFCKRRKVGELTHMQALAYWRHSMTRGVWYSFMCGGGFKDVRLIGDLDAVMSADDAEKNEE